MSRKEADEKQTRIYLFAPVIRANSWLSLVSHGGRPMFLMLLGGNKTVVDKLARRLLAKMFFRSYRRPNEIPN